MFRQQRQYETGVLFLGRSAEKIRGDVKKCTSGAVFPLGEHLILFNDSTCAFCMKKMK